MVFIFIAYAGVIEILPDFANRARPLEGTKPPTVLQLAGKHVYMKDSCNACHTQQIRPFKAETDRYGMYSLSGEYAFDRPHLWGSKRTGPDLWRVGNYRSIEEATRMLNAIQALGYKQAVIVKGKITVQN